MNWTKIKFILDIITACISFFLIITLPSLRFFWIIVLLGTLIDVYSNYKKLKQK